MKKILKMSLAILAASGMILMTGCGNSASQTENGTSQEAARVSETAELSEIDASEETSADAEMLETSMEELTEEAVPSPDIMCSIRITAGDTILDGVLYDNETARGFAEMDRP